MQQNKKTELPAASNTRECTEAELVFLTQALNTLPTPKKSYLKALLNTAVFWIFSLAALCVFWFIITLVISFIFNFNIGLSSAYSTSIFSLMVVCSALFSINSTRKWLQKNHGLYQQIKADISIKKTLTERYEVVAVKCFKEPQHNGLIYLLCLKSTTTNNNKIRVIYDYASQDTEASAEDLITIKTKLIINLAPQSQTFLNYQYYGQQVLDIKHYDLKVPPEQWPVADRWLNEDWNTLEKQYSIN